MRSHIARRLKAGKWCGTKFCGCVSILIGFLSELSQQMGHNQNNSQSNGQDQQQQQQQGQSEAPQIMQIQQNC